MAISRPKAIFLDSNIALRFLAQDDPTRYTETARLFQAIERGALKPVLSNIVIAEVIFVLTRLYKFDRLRAYKAAALLLRLRNLTLIERTDTRRAIEIWKEHNIKYGDCLIASQIPKNTVLVTYDADFKKIESLRAMTPDQFVT